MCVIVSKMTPFQEIWGEKYPFCNEIKKYLLTF